MHTRVWPVSFIWNAWNESIRVRVETYVPHFHVAVVLFPKTCDWKQNISLFVREVALFIPGSVSPAPVNIRGVRIWGRPGPGSPVPCLTRTRRARLWLADVGQCRPLIGPCYRPLPPLSQVSARSELTAQIQTTDWVEFLCRCICKVLQWRLGLELQWSKWQTAVIVVSRAERPAECADQSGNSAVFICLTDRQHGPSPSSDPVLDITGNITDSSRQQLLNCIY